MISLAAVLKCVLSLFLLSLSPSAQIFIFPPPSSSFPQLMNEDSIASPSSAPSTSILGEDEAPLVVFLALRVACLSGKVHLSVPGGPRVE